VTRRTAAKKWRLPQDVKHLNTEQLNRVQLLTMLEFMGIPSHMQPTHQPKKAEALREQIVLNVDKAQTAYDVVVWNKLPQATAEVSDNAEAMKAHYFGVMDKLLTGEQMETMRSKVAEMAEDVKTQLVEHGRKALDEAARNYRPVKITQGKVTRVVKGVLPQEFERIVQLASQRVPVMLVGPAGCGKTFVAAKVAESLDLDFYDQSCSEGVSESIFTGWLLPVSAGGKFDYVSSPFIQCYEGGGVFLLDEMDAADPNLLTFLNKAIANESFFLPQRHRKPLVKKHKDFVVVAAANTFGKGADAEYVGRNALDAATLDRFRAGMVHMDYSAEVETALSDPEVLAWGRQVRECIYANKLRRIMSTRVLLDLTKMKQNCEWGRDEWERAFFADWSEPEVRFWRDHSKRSGTSENV
jgi:cobaltochelatase CobS